MIVHIVIATDKLDGKDKRKDFVDCYARINELRVAVMDKVCGSHILKLWRIRIPFG